jgi:hypothetical protein
MGDRRRAARTRAVERATRSEDDAAMSVMTMRQWWWWWQRRTVRDGGGKPEAPSMRPASQGVAACAVACTITISIAHSVSEGSVTRHP